MNKEEILKRLAALEQEAAEICAEQANLRHMLELAHGGRADALQSHLLKMQLSINARIVRWNQECDLLETEAKKLAA